VKIALIPCSDSLESGRGQLPPPKLQSATAVRPRERGIRRARDRLLEREVLPKECRDRIAGVGGLPMAFESSVLSLLLPSVPAPRPTVHARAFTVRRTDAAPGPFNHLRGRLREYHARGARGCVPAEPREAGRAGLVAALAEWR
jgi:hypothetical protein